MQTHLNNFPEFNHLSAEMQLYIMSFLDAKTLRQTASACQAFNIFSNQNATWLNLLARDYNLDCKEFLNSIADNMQWQTPVSPKLIYKFLHLLNKCYLTLETEKATNIDLFNLGFPSVATDVKYLVDMQLSLLFSKGASASQLSQLRKILTEIFHLVTTHFVIASLMFYLNDAARKEKKFTNGGIITLLLQKHIGYFETLDLTLIAFKNPFEVLNFIARNLSNNIFRKLILPYLDYPMYILILENNFKNLKTLLIHCDPERFVNYNNNAGFKSLFQNLLTNTTLHKIEIRNKAKPHDFFVFEKDLAQACCKISP